MSHAPTADPRSDDPSRRRRRWRKLAIIALAIVLAYTLFGFLGVPLLVRHVVAPRLSRSLNGSITIAKARFNPYTFVLRLQGASVVDETGQRVLGVGEFSSDFQLLDTIFSSGYHFKDTIVREPFAHIELFPDGSNTLTRLIKPEPPLPTPAKQPPKPARIPRLVMRLLDVSGGAVEFRDNTLAEPYATQIDGLTFTLQHLDTRPKPANPHTLIAHTSSGATLGWEGEFHLDPLTSNGALKLSGLELSQFGPYLTAFTPGRVTSGSFSIDLTYDFAPAASPRVAKVNVRSLSIDTLGIAEPAGPLATLSHLGVRDANLDASARTADIASIAITHPALTIDRDEHGTLNALRLLPPRAANAPQASATRADAPALETASSPSGDQSPAIPDNGEDRRIDQLRIAITHLLRNIAGDWAVAVQDVRIDDAGASFTDRSTSPNVAIPIAGVAIVAGPIKSADGFATPVKLQGAIGTKGTFDVQGVVKPLDQNADIAVKVANLDAALAAPYLPSRFDPSLPPARLASASIDLDGKAAASRTPAGDLRATWNGQARLSTLSIEPTDATNGTALLALASLDTNGETVAILRHDSPPSLQWKGNLETTDVGAALPISGGATFSMARGAVDGQLDLAGSVLSFMGNAEANGINAAAPGRDDAKFTLASFGAKEIVLDSSAPTASVNDVVINSPALSAALPLLPPTKNEDPKDAKAPENAPPESRASAANQNESAKPDSVAAPSPARPIVTIQHLRITNGSGDFIDPSATPPLRLQADQFTLDAVGLSTDGKNPAQFTTTARVQESGQMRIAGTINPFAKPPAIDAKIEMAALPLKPYDAVTGRYVGYLVDQGRMTLTMPVAIREGQLKGELDVNLDRFYLGDSFKSPDAPNVPVKLGLNLLRDGSEQITARVGFSGKLDDPSFSFGGIVWKAFFNLIVKAATSPFKVLGSLFGASDDQDLSRIAFDPGVADLSPKSLASLDVLAKGMRGRPALKLSIVGRTSESDIPALKKIILRERLLKIAQRDDRKLAVLTEAQYRDLLDSEFGDTYGNDQKRRKNAQGKTERITFEEMEAKLLADTDVSAERLAALAKARAEAVAGVLTKDNSLPVDRVAISNDTPSGPAEQPQADLQMEK
jgi:hypothetical protein